MGARGAEKDYGEHAEVHTGTKALEEGYSGHVDLDPSLSQILHHELAHLQEEVEELEKCPVSGDWGPLAQHR